MLPGMRAKPSIAIVGPGNVGTSLALSLVKAGFVVETVIARSRGSLRKAQQLAKQVKALPAADLSATKADLIWICVPDSQIAEIARMSTPKLVWKERTVFHSSGALTSDELDPLRRMGAQVASVHPLMTFVRGSQPSLAGVSFAIEGDHNAVRLARRVVRDLGGHSYPILKKNKPAYHAWGTFTSPLFTALLATSEKVAASAGVQRKAARQRMIPILQQTLANYAAFGASRAFSGPIIRGDVVTIRRHLKVLGKMSVAREVYSALAQAALQYLPAKNKSVLKRVLRPSRQ